MPRTRSPQSGRAPARAASPRTIVLPRVAKAALCCVLLCAAALRRTRWAPSLPLLDGRTVAIWQSDRAVAWTRRTLDLGADHPSIRSDVRSVVVRRDRLRPGVGAELVAAWAVTDDDARARTASQYILTWAREPELRYSGRLRDPMTGASVVFIGVRYRWRYSHEVVFEVPDSFAWPSGRSATVELEMSAELGNRAVAAYDFVLRPVATPRSSLALCSKPLYAPPSPALSALLSECAPSPFARV